MPAFPNSSPESESVRKLIGTLIGERYKVLSLIGQGSVGAVFLVEHTVIRKRLALKLLNDEMMKDPKAVARFEREALAAAHIDHPNVAAATDSGRSDGGGLFVVFEYVEGQSLRDHIRRGPMAPHLTLHIIKQVASVLVRAHGLGITHRHLKPENIMLVPRDGDDSMVKVLDFGLAKLSAQQLLEEGGAAPQGEVLTSYGAVVGTPEYMAPEQAAGGAVDGRTDLYAVGILLYEMLTGVLPFSGDAAALLRQHLTAAAPSIKSRAPNLKVPPALEALVRKLLEKLPEKRFESAKVLLEAIDALVNAEQLKYDPGAPSRKAPPSLSGEKPASESETVVAPPDLAAKALGLPPPGWQGESLALALKDLKDPSADEKARSEDPSLNGLAMQFGATSAAGVIPAAGVPPMLAAASSEPDGPPKLKAPSSLDAEALQPEGAAQAVLTPAPPPTLTERARDAVNEAVGSLREAGIPQAKGALSRAMTTVRTKVPEHYAKLLDAVRARLPEKHRGFAKSLVGLIVGAVLALPILILIIAFSGGDSSSSSSNAAMPGFASERDMEKAVSGGVRDLAKLAVKCPSDSRVFRALARAHVARKDYVGAMHALSTLARLDPTMAGDDEMSQITATAAVMPETSDVAISLLESQLGDRGVGVLSDLAERTMMEPWKGKLNASLQKGTTRALASEATIVLMDLRAAQRCEDKRTLLRRASQQGDARTLTYLQGLQQQTTGCGPSGQNDCWPCLHKGTALKATIDTLGKRLGG